jgi:hypothetical protein
VLLRLPLAFLLGLVIYMIAMMMTTYDGVLSMILQPLMGALLTGLFLVALCILGSPLLFRQVWEKWRHLPWIPIALTLAGIASFIVSWHPLLREKVLNPDTHAWVESFHPALGIGGWLAAMFGVAFCPLIGLHGDRRWV